MTVAFLVLERSSLYYICQGARCIISVKELAVLYLSRSSLYYICPLWFDPRVPFSTQEVQTMTVAFLVLERSSLYYICQGARCIISIKELAVLCLSRSSLYYIYQGARCIISVLSGLIQESQSLHRKSRP
ncbi:hypothetical protein RRG08_053242 [Elysia crispata]|uniref:Uncharacterized protein n=1 Tax=Elysia crispata TaxID=231223 RepID=A0AAE1APF7_9GAST|nr:hypothetical protein RRG08_053240 [Elysia crispata]KAK3790918.1 hypothetical protein RRG08_053242 [Elysia crispata]